MSKPKENDQQGNNSGDPISDNASEEEVLTIEEHKKNLNVDAPVFAAVMQTQKWGSGKRVPKAVFEKAVKDFLGAPMGGN